MKTSWRRLSSSFSEDVLIKTNIFALLTCLRKTPLRRLQDILIKTNIFVLAIHLHDVFKTFPRRIQDIFKTSCQDVFKSFWRRVQDIFKTSSRRFKEVFKTSSGHLQDVLQRCLQDLSKMYHQIKLFA